MRKNYKRKMKDLVLGMSRVEITEERRARYLLETAKLNTAFHILRDSDRRARYWQERQKVMALEDAWREAAQGNGSRLRGNDDAVRKSGISPRFPRVSGLPSR